MKRMLLVALTVFAASSVNVWAKGAIDEIEQGMRDVRGGSVPQLATAAARADAADVTATKNQDRGPAYDFGFRLGALLLELDSNVASNSGDRPAVEREVREVVAAQQKLGLSDRAVCLISGLADPSSFQSLMRLGAPEFTCGHHH